jgi:8-oxo-dGTP diphosphatase
MLKKVYFRVFFCVSLFFSSLILAEHKPPILTTTAIIEVYKEGGAFQGIVLIKRGKEPYGFAIPGGNVEYGETVEQAVRREIKEEVNLELIDLRQFHVYSDLTRDFRHHSVEVAHLAKASSLPQAGDDAADAFVVQLDEIPWEKMAFHHAMILRDYLRYRNTGDSYCAMVQ